MRQRCEGKASAFRSHEAIFDARAEPGVGSPVRVNDFFLARAIGLVSNDRTKGALAASESNGVAVALMMRT